MRSPEFFAQLNFTEVLPQKSASKHKRLFEWLGQVIRTAKLKKKKKKKRLIGSNYIKYSFKR